MCKIITSTTTTTREVEMKVKAEALAKVVASNDVKSRVDAAQTAASKALSALNKSRQSDVFASVLKDTDAHPIVTLSKVGVYSAAGYKLPEEGQTEVKYQDASALLSLSRFFNEAGTEKVGAKAEWRSLVKDAVHLSMIKLAQGLKVDVSALMVKLDVSGEVKEAVRAAKRDNNGEMSYARIQKALQVALDAIHTNTGTRDDGKNMYQIDRASCRWLEASFGINKVTGHIVVPTQDTMNDRMFQIMRHVIAGVPYDFEKSGK